jgi:hypothetical protein
MNLHVTVSGYFLCDLPGDECLHSLFDHHLHVGYPYPASRCIYLVEWSAEANKPKSGLRVSI